MLPKVEITSRPRQKYIRNNLSTHAIFYLEQSNCKCLNVFVVSTGYFGNLYWAVGSYIIVSTRDLCEFFTQYCLVFLTNMDLVSAELFLYFSHILLNFWISREWLHVVFAFEKQINMSFVKSAFFFSDRLYIKSRNYDVPKIVIPLSQSTGE